MISAFIFFFFFFNDTATTEIYTLSLHDALPISDVPLTDGGRAAIRSMRLPKTCAEQRSGLDAARERTGDDAHLGARSEEHTSELQSRPHLVCRLLLEKKKKKTENSQIT